MRIAVIANDTRGGVQPYAALGVGLQRAGHEVTVVAPSHSIAMLTELGLATATLSGDAEAEAEAGANTAANRRGPIASMRYVARELTPRIEAWTRETLAACEGADLLTGGVGGMITGLSVAERLGVPFVPTHLQPIGAPTGDHPGVLMTAIPSWLGRPGRLAGHRLTELALWTPFAKPMATARRTVLGLSGRARAADGQPVLYGFSPRVVDLPPRPGHPRHVTGYWFLPAGPMWTPPPALEAFLARTDSPVVSIGFGSMANQDPAAVTDLVLGAVRDAGVRAVLLSGWGGLATAAGSDDALVVEAVPHDWLFPRVTAAVHHGGAGTTGAALAAGVPAVVVPFSVDQPFWASRVTALGVGPTPIPRKRLTREALAAALRTAVTDEAMTARAAALGRAIRAEDGVAAAVTHFQDIGPRR